MTKIGTKQRPPGVHYSPSQINTYVDCPRKWFFGSILKLRAEPGEAQNWGTAAHSLVEHWLRTGETPTSNDNMGIRVRKYIEALKKERTQWPHDQLLIEHNAHYPFEIDGKARFIWGILDVVDPVPNEWHDLEIFDHKTMGSFRYAKKAEELRYDRQMLIYGKAGLEQFPHARNVRVTHGQMLREGPIECQIPSALLTRDHVEEQWEDNLVLIGQMEKDRVAMHPSAVGICGTPGQASGCKKYGGCEYVKPCVEAQLGGFMPAINPPDSTRRKPGDPPLIAENLEDKLKASVKAEKEKKMAKSDIMEKLRAAKALQKKDAQTKTETQAEEAPPAEETQAEPKDTSKKKAAPKSSGKLTLYVNCRPTKGTRGAVVSVEEILAPVMAELAEKSGKADYRFHEYGEGKGRLVQVLRTMDLPPGVYVDKRSDLGGFVLEALRPRATKVVEGL